MSKSSMQRLGIKVSVLPFTSGLAWPLALLVSALCLITVTGISWSQELLQGDQLKSINQFDGNELGQVRVITKSWYEENGSLNRFKRFDFSFYGYSNEVRASARGFMQDIKVYDGTQPVDVSDWDTSSDCSLAKMLIMKSRALSVFLITAHRISSEGSDIIPNSEPAPQKIVVFKLVDNKGPNEHERLTRSYFQKISEATSEEKACTDKDVYKLMETLGVKQIGQTEK